MTADSTPLPGGGAPPGQTFADISRTARLLGLFVAPTTLLTALLFYFGWAHVYWFFDHFGVDATTLPFSTRDYVMRSVDALFVPVVVVAVVVVASMWTIGLLPPRYRRLPNRAAVTVTVAGIALGLVINGLLRMVGVVWPPNSGLCVAPTCVVVGVLLLWYLSSSRRRRGMGESRSEGVVVAEWAMIFVLVGISLFWIATDYSVAVGQTRARQAEAQLATRPGVIIYSERDLQLMGPGVTETVCSTVDDVVPAYLLRYDGLVLLTQVADQYVLLARRWNSGDGTAVILPRAGIGGVRFEFAEDPERAVAPFC